MPQDPRFLNLAITPQVANDLDCHSPCLLAEPRRLPRNHLSVVSTPCQPFGEDLQFTLTLSLAVSLNTH